MRALKSTMIAALMMIGGNAHAAGITTFDLTTVSGGTNFTDSVTGDVGGELNLYAFGLFNDGTLIRRELKQLDGVGIDDGNSGTQVDNFEIGGAPSPAPETDLLVVEFTTNDWIPISATIKPFTSPDKVNLWASVGSSDPTTWTTGSDFSFDFLGQVDLTTITTLSFADFGVTSAHQYIAFTAPILNGSGNDADGDQFVVQSIVGNDISAVPLPAAFPLMALVVGGFGVASWRKRRLAA